MNKLDINDFGNSFEKIKKKVENIDNDLDRLIQSVKDQFQAINVAINKMTLIILVNLLFFFILFSPCMLFHNVFFYL